MPRSCAVPPPPPHIWRNGSSAANGALPSGPTRARVQVLLVPLPTLVPLVHFVPEGLLAVRAHPASARSWMDVDSVARVRSNLQRTHTCVVAYSGDAHLRSSL